MMANTYGMIGGQSGNPPTSYNIIPSTTNQKIPADTLLEKNMTIQGDSDLVSSNIKAGTSIFDINGSYASFDESAQNSVAFLSKDNYTVEYPIRNVSDVNITEKVVPGITPMEDYDLTEFTHGVATADNTIWYFGKNILYVYKTDTNFIICIDNLSGNTISSIDISQYAPSTETLPNFQAKALYVEDNSDVFVMICQQAPLSSSYGYPLYIVNIENGINVSSVLVSSQIDATDITICSSINDRIVGFSFIESVNHSANCNRVIIYDTILKKIIQIKQFAFSEYSTMFSTKISILKPSNVSYYTKTGENYSIFRYIYLGSASDNSFICNTLTLENLNFVTHNNYTLPYSIPVSTSYSQAGLVAVEENNIIKFIFSYSVTNSSAQQYWACIFCMSIDGTTLWKHRFGDRVSHITEPTLDRYVNTIIVTYADASVYGDTLLKYKIIDTTQTFSTQGYSIYLDIYNKIYYDKSHFQIKRVFDTSVEITRTITTDTYTATIEEV